MANKTFQGRIIQKHDTKANWDKATNFVPLKGEIIVYDDLKKIKIGDGATKVGSLAFINDLDTLATVAKTGSYSDLKNKPTIPSVGNGTLTIQKNGTSAGTFTANATTNKTINITVPTKVSELTDDVVKGKYLPLTGGTMTGNININNKTITNLKTPTADTEAVNKKYVDDSKLSIVGTSTTYPIYIGSSTPASGTAPLLWIDTTSSTGVFKYRTSTTGTWTAVPVAYT